MWLITEYFKMEVHLHAHTGFYRIAGKFVKFGGLALRVETTKFAKIIFTCNV